jgi:TfoX/Sxy family transcriptional regulator of competence genes
VVYDDALAQRLRELLEEDGATEKRMFGGLAFLVDGHLAVAASGQGGLMLRCHPDDTDLLVAEPGAQPFVMRGKPMPGWLRVDLDAEAPRERLRSWVAPAVAYARSLD